MRREGRLRVCPNYSSLRSTQRLGISASPQSSPCPTTLLNGALTALRPARRTDKRPQLHHRLIESPCSLAVLGHESPGELRNPPGCGMRDAGWVGAGPHPASRIPHPDEDARDDAGDVRIYSRDRSLVREAGDGARRIAADTRQLDQLLGIIRQRGVEVPTDHARQRVEIGSPGVIPESVPRLPHRLRPRAGEGLEIGEPLEKPGIVLRHPADLRLLQHHFRDEHAVRIARLAPGEVSRGAGVPGEELLGKCLGALRFSAAGGGRTGHAYTRYSHMARGAEITLDLRRLVGRWSLRAAGHAGRFTYLILDMCRGLTEWRVYLPLAFRQAMSVGYGSLFIVLLVSGFTGAVTSLQAGYQFTGTVPLYVYGAVIAESIILELGPVLTGLILAGRIGARYAAELGTMRVTEQIDALESLGRSPA